MPAEPHDRPVNAVVTPAGSTPLPDGLEGQPVLGGLVHRVLAERPRARATVGPELRLVGVVRAEGVPAGPGEVHPRRGVEVGQRHDHPHRRHPVHLVADGASHPVASTIADAAAELPRPAVEQRRTDPAARLADRAVAQLELVLVAPRPVRGPARLQPDELVTRLAHRLPEDVVAALLDPVGLDVVPPPVGWAPRGGAPPRRTIVPRPRRRRWRAAGRRRSGAAGCATPRCSRPRPTSRRPGGSPSRAAAPGRLSSSGSRRPRRAGRAPASARSGSSTSSWISLMSSTLSLPFFSSRSRMRCERWPGSHASPRNHGYSVPDRRLVGRDDEALLGVEDARAAASKGTYSPVQSYFLSQPGLGYVAGVGRPPDRDPPGGLVADVAGAVGVDHVLARRGEVPGGGTELLPVLRAVDLEDRLGRLGRARSAVHARETA